MKEEEIKSNKTNKEKSGDGAGPHEIGWFTEEAVRMSA
jgi:hypothetical protein